jgi:uncharacterized Zn finger protein
MFYEWRRYVTVGERRRKAALAMAKLRKKGHAVSPVVIEGRTIARTFWGKAWCDNLERYSDYANRLPRGRTYVRNGSVVDLQIATGEIKALVSGSAMYKVTVKVTPVPLARWRSICKDCAGAIDSLIELLQGRFSNGVMERICQQRTGLFPSPAEITLACTCPDWATVCKHVAAVFYGIGARLDKQPGLLFKLREVNEKELIAGAGKGLSAVGKKPAAAKVLEGGDLAEIFGLDMAQGAPAGSKVVEKKRAEHGRTKAPASRKKAPRVKRGGSGRSGKSGKTGRINASAKKKRRKR